MNKNGIFVIDKPEGYTSFEIVKNIRNKFKFKKVGHTGTLDPMATGVLVLCTNSATKIIQYLTEDDKEYDVVMRLGYESDTLDRTGEVYKTSIPENISDTKIKQTVLNFIGPQKQIPPMYSAKKINGQRLYNLARNGIEIERKPNNIIIKDIFIKKIIRSEKYIDINYVTSVSKGTYIRVLCSDIAEKLGTTAIMQELKRIRVGNVTIEESVSLKNVTKDCMQDIDKILPYQTIILPIKFIKKFFNGSVITQMEYPEFNFLKFENKKVIVKTEQDIVVGIAQINNNRYKMIHPIKVFN